MRLTIIAIAGLIDPAEIANADAEDRVGRGRLKEIPDPGDSFI
jgi:hypothetical protein